MQTSSFARIGKGVLSKAIGLQKNYIEEYYKGPDVLKEDCFSCYKCDIYKQKEMLRMTGQKESADNLLHTECYHCSSAVWESSYIPHRRYINEKNRYGYQPTLKSNSIKLLLLYHFLQPDGQGFIKNVNIKELSLYLNCTTATIIACNKVLQDYNYCYICDSGFYDHCINVYLPEYKNYHKTASEGGRGYITISSDLLHDLCEMKQLNTLRLNLKGILEVDNASYSDTHNHTLSSAVSTFKKLRGFLPNYCKNNVIRNALKKSDTIFDLTFQKKAVKFSIKQKYSQKNLRDAMLDDIKENLIEHVEHINSVLEDAAAAQLPDEKEKLEEILSALHISPAENYSHLCIKLSDYKDLASLSLQYGLSQVYAAIGTIYNKYTAQGRPIEQIGALARTIIRNWAFSEIAS